jgi:malate permease and related proteins
VTALRTTALAGVILTFVVIVALGWLLRVTRRLTAADARPINAVIIYVGLPAFIVKAVHTARLDAELAVVVAIAWAVLAASLAIGLLSIRMLKLPKTTAGGFLLAVALGNTGFIGYPVTQALLGARMLPSAIFYDIFGTVAALILVGLPIAEHYGGGEERRRHPLREVLGFPAVGAVLVGLATRGVPFSNSVSHGLDMLASLVVPLIMISVGLSLRAGMLRHWAAPLALIAVLRLVLAPLIALAIARLALGGDAESLRLVTLQAGMPTMMLALIVGARFELDTDFIASAILVTTVASALSIPLMQSVVG